ncbi:hypothetical protein N9W34_04615 [Rickettsiales bacterium]|nr:hypothetical protein [Rickettsiales bacterium]
MTTNLPDPFQPYVQTAIIATAAIAFLALIRPEIQKVWQYFKGTLEFHPRERIIVGFTCLGPRFSVDGTLESIARKHFINAISINVKRLTDNAEHDFFWELWESTVLGRDAGSASPAYPFPLFKDNILQGLLTFGDQKTKGRFFNHLIDLQSKFREFVSAQPEQVPPEKRIYKVKEFNDLESEKPTSPIHLEIKDIMDRSFYWDSGEYSVEMVIKTTKPKKSFKYSFTFSLSDEESKQLKENLIMAQLDACDIPNIIYHKAYPKINDFKKI